MVAVALVDLALIGFDLTYLWLRPTYLRVAPGLVALYDPVKGMRPHPASQGLLREMDATRDYLRSLGDSPADPEVLATHVAALRGLTLRVMRENAFRHSEAAGANDMLLEAVADRVAMDPAGMDHPPNQEKGVAKLWPTMNQAELMDLLGRDGPVKDALKANYYRAVDRSGWPVDHFGRLELPLLSLFWLDFWIGWAIALRRSERWYRYPLVHWYDVLGLLPGRLRVFRLFRLVSIYSRIYRGELQNVRDNAIKRMSSRAARAITDEVTNQVQLRVVERLKTEFEEKTFHHSLEASLSRHRGELIDAVVAQLQSMLAAPHAQQQALELAALTTNEALAGTRSWPLARGLTHTLFEHAFLAALAAFARVLESEDGRRTARQLLTTALASPECQSSREQLVSIVSEVASELVRDIGAAAERRSLMSHAAEPEEPGTDQGSWPFAARESATRETRH
ncbi:MAG: hypothetical protein QM778_04845 [Myxococcales bacterium]